LGSDIVIEPFDEAQLNPNSYNLSLHHEFMVYEEVVLDMAKANRVRRLEIPPEDWCSVPTNSVGTDSRSGR
jgi:dCTP deaminase